MNFIKTICGILAMLSFSSRGLAQIPYLTTKTGVSKAGDRMTGPLTNTSGVWLPGDAGQQNEFSAYSGSGLVGFTWSFTNAASANLIVDSMDLNTNGLTLNKGVYNGNAGSLTNVHGTNVDIIYRNNLTATTNTSTGQVTVDAAASGGATNLTPWTSDINGAQFSLTNAANIVATGTYTGSAAGLSNLFYYGSGVQVILPSGVSRNYSTMELAFAAATTNSIIRLGQQTFVPAHSLLMPTNSVLIGNNSKVIWTNVQTLLYPSNGACVIPSDNCQIKNVYFTDTNTAVADAFVTFVSRSFGSATNFLIDGCRFEGVIDSLVFGTNNLQGVIRGCRFGGAYDQVAIYSEGGPRTTNTFDLVVDGCKFVFDTRASGIPEPLAVNSASGRIRFYNCEFVNAAPGSITLNLFTIDTVTNLVAEFYNCSCTETMAGTFQTSPASSRPSLYNCNFLAQNVKRPIVYDLDGLGNGITNLGTLVATGLVRSATLIVNNSIDDTIGILSIDPNDRILADTSGAHASLSWDLRALYHSDDSTALDWSINTLSGDWIADSKLHVEGNLNGTGTSNYFSGIMSIGSGGVNMNGNAITNGAYIFRTPTALTDGATVATDVSTNRSFTLTLTGNNHVLSNPINGVDMEEVTWRLVQNSAGTWSMSLGSKFTFPTNGIITGFTISTNANSTTYLKAFYNSSEDEWQVIGNSWGH